MIDDIANPTDGSRKEKTNKQKITSVITQWWQQAGKGNMIAFINVLSKILAAGRQLKTEEVMIFD